jgi:hypothetical protein
MKKVILFLLLTMIMVSCNYEEPAPIDFQAETLQIKTVLEKYVIANEKQDFEIIEQIWAAYDDIVMIGTDSDERLIGWAQIEKAIKNQFKSFHETYITVSNQVIRINESGNTASFSELLAYNFIYEEQAKSFEGMRFTGVLEKIDGNWLLVQGHLSLPAEVEMNEVY